MRGGPFCTPPSDPLHPPHCIPQKPCRGDRAIPTRCRFISTFQIWPVAPTICPFWGADWSKTGPNPRVGPGATRQTGDRAQDPACAAVRKNLEEEVLAGWDPEAIAERMVRRRADRELIAQWAANTQPADQYRWERKREMDYLDEEQP